MIQYNPFVLEGYKGAEYFCDRALDTQLLCEHIHNQRNVALISKRRLGKSGLILHTFNQKEISQNYYTFYVDIYDTKTLAEFTYEFGKCVLETLKPLGRQVWESFISALKSLKMSVSFDINGNPEWGVSLGDIHTPDVMLDEIFHYLEHADKPCLVAIDEFQVVAEYPEKTVEATLRKRIQTCRNVQFIYSGSQRHMMAEMFASHARPFYNSSALMGLEPIDKELYREFANKHLASNSHSISNEAFDYLYEWSEGVTWYIQNVLNVLFSTNTAHAMFTLDDIDHAINTILQRNTFAYKALLYQLGAKQKAVLVAIAKEGHVEKVMAQDFLRRHSLTASTVQGAIKVLLDRDFITREDNLFQIHDYFFGLYLRRNA